MSLSIQSINTPRTVGVKLLKGFSDRFLQCRPRQRAKPPGYGGAALVKQGLAGLEHVLRRLEALEQAGLHSLDAGHCRIRLLGRACALKCRQFRFVPHSRDAPAAEFSISLQGCCGQDTASCYWRPDRGPQCACRLTFQKSSWRAQWRRDCAGRLHLLPCS